MSGPPATARTIIRPLEDRLAAQRFLLEHIRRDSSPGSLDPLSPGQWVCLVEEASRHRIGPLAWHRVSAGPHADVMPADVRERLKSLYVRNAFRNAILGREVAAAALALARERIPAMMLKGIHLARFVYADAALRTMADIDIMVPRDRLEDAQRILVGIGYGPEPRPPVESYTSWSNQLAVFEKEGAGALEVHYAIERPTSPFRIDHDALWQRARPARIEDAEVLLLDTEDLLLHLALHLAYHHHFERAALKGLVDVTMVLDHADPPVDWRRLASRADAWGAADFTRATLRVARDVLGARVDDDALAALGASDEDEAVAGVATRYILTPAVELPVAIDEMGRSAGLTGRLGHLLRAVFLSPAQMRELYGLRPGSPLAWLYYPVRVIDLLARRGSLAMRLMLRTASVEPTLDRAQDGRTLERWAEAAAAAQTNARAPREESTS